MGHYKYADLVPLDVQVKQWIRQNLKLVNGVVVNKKTGHRATNKAQLTIKDIPWPISWVAQQLR